MLIVEDDDAIAHAIEIYLVSWGLKAACVTDFSNVMAEFAAYDPQLVLLDIKLPFFNGYHWCRQIRGVSKAPIIFISSAAENMNIVMAMNMGGDDFLSKPFDLEVLIARCRRSCAARTIQRSGALMECRRRPQHGRRDAHV